MSFTLAVLRRREGGNAGESKDGDHFEIEVIFHLLLFSLVEFVAHLRKRLQNIENFVSIVCHLTPYLVIYSMITLPFME